MQKTCVYMQMYDNFILYITNIYYQFARYFVLKPIKTQIYLKNGISFMPKSYAFIISMFKYVDILVQFLNYILIY